MVGSPWRDVIYTLCHEGCRGPADGCSPEPRLWAASICHPSRYEEAPHFLPLVLNSLQHGNETSLCQVYVLTQELLLALSRSLAA